MEILIRDVAVVKTGHSPNTRQKQGFTRAR